jgi:hypothetical protein
VDDWRCLAAGSERGWQEESLTLEITEERRVARDGWCCIGLLLEALL